MRLGLNIEFEGKSYDILELPTEAFSHLVPCLRTDQMKLLEKKFVEYWPDKTRCRHHMLSFLADQIGASIDYVLLTHQNVRFDDKDITDYIDEHVNQGNRLH